MSVASADINMDDLMELVVSEEASDLHLQVGAPPVLRVHGALHSLETEMLTAEDTRRLMLEITPEEYQQELEREGGSDFGIGVASGARFRVSVFKQKKNIGMIMRLLPNRMMNLQEIGLTPQVEELLYKPRGLILVTGPTGSGKTTTLASMLNLINEKRGCNIITVEDPIEYFHEHKSGLVMQREVGVDVPSFAEALRRGLRQDPDVILVGEMRDLETMEAAITAAETGHLVFGTLHTTGSARTVDRIVDAFPTEQQELVRTQLSVSLNAVISQLLLPRRDKPGRIAIFEIMICTPSIRALIRENKSYRLTSDIQTGGKHGMITLDDCLLRHYREGHISYEDMMTKSQDPEDLMHKIESAKKR